MIKFESVYLISILTLPEIPNILKIFSFGHGTEFLSKPNQVD